jgi:glycosyltransferase involved in cell wall biosynthesis
VQRPLVTFITVVWNGFAEIDSTIQSVLPFLASQVQYIIIDGGSTDGTLERIKAWESKITRWISRKDKGIYDAMNTGIKMADGEFVCFINIGDRLLNCPTKQLEEALATDAVAISFPVQLSNGNIFYPSFSGKIKLENTLHHQGTYYRKDKIREYNISLKTFADFDLNQDLYKNGSKVLIDHSTINSFHSVDGFSQNKKGLKELFSVVRKNYGVFFYALSYVHFKIKYGLKPKLRRLSKSHSIAD